LIIAGGVASLVIEYINKTDQKRCNQFHQQARIIISVAAVCFQVFELDALGYKIKNDKKNRSYNQVNKCEIFNHLFWIKTQVVAPLQII
jgi:hypothetical protein